MTLARCVAHGSRRSAGLHDCTRVATAAFSARLKVRRVDVYGAIVLPLDSGTRDLTYSNYIGCPGPLPLFRSALTFGAAYRFR